MEKKIKLFDTSFTQNRELSWLRFNQRVLEEAQDDSVPLLERLRFVSIFSSNLDEFFMIRVGSLHDMSLLKSPHIDNKSNLTPSQQLDRIFAAVRPLYKKRDKILQEIESQLQRYQIFVLHLENLANGDKKYLERYFQENVQPVLSPQIVDPLHPFPHLANGALNIVTRLKLGDRENIMGIVPIPASLPAGIFLPGEPLRYLAMDQLILLFTDQLFPLYQTISRMVVSVTRNADINLEEENDELEEDYRHHMKKVLKKRGRLAPVRLEYQGDCDKKLLLALRSRLGLQDSQQYRSRLPIHLPSPDALAEKLPLAIRRRLTYPPFESRYPADLPHGPGLIKHLQQQDLLLLYPFESMDPFLHLLKEAANDSSVLSIKITIYRLASKSKVVEHLCTAAENGKEVTVLMELRARFDEDNNIQWAERLEESGCRVIYGFESFKVHSKICLITRRDKGKISYITQIGTGNYNEKTSRLYTDFSLITGNPDIGSDAAEFFKNMALSNLDGIYKKLLVAPRTMKPGWLTLIDQQIALAKEGKPSRILMKMNSLTEREMIDKLVEASCAGVPVQLIVRGICCILPGIPGKTERVSVTSIVGRFLEHSRVYCFGVDDPQIYISSADLMTRNLTRRVEIACPILDSQLKEQILEILSVILHDTQKARILQPDGSYRLPQREKKLALDCQQYFLEHGWETAKPREKERPSLWSKLTSIISGHKQ